MISGASLIASGRVPSTIMILNDIAAPYVKNDPMKILVVCQDYPRVDNKSVMAFVHSRNLYCKELKHSVEVLSFQCDSSYLWDGISVFPESDFSKDRLRRYDATFLHMPNLRNGLRFLWRYRSALVRPCLVIHGHELLNWTRYVPKLRDLSPSESMRRGGHRAYDEAKLLVWRWFFKTQQLPKLRVLFVSQWMKEQAERSLQMSFDALGIPNTIVHNPIHPAFVRNTFDPHRNKIADFVTIRSFDDPKYGLDIVREIAFKHPAHSFHVFGEGEFFRCNPPPENLKVFYQRFAQIDLPSHLNKYGCALLPTRVDSQGVFMCEVASMGMPILVSDLAICREMVGDFKNVGFFANDNPGFDLQIPPVDVRPPREKFLVENTVASELRFAFGEE